MNMSPAQPALLSGKKLARYLYRSITVSTAFVKKSM